MPLLQYNQALVGVLSGDNGYTRDDIILQTKLGPCADNAQFRKDLEDRFTRLSGLEYLDLFGFHGINRMEQIDWILRPGGNMEVPPHPCHRRILIRRSSPVSDSMSPPT